MNFLSITIRIAFVRYRKDGHRRFGELSTQVAQLRSASAQLRRDAASLGVLRRRSAGYILRSARGGSSIRPRGLLVVPQPYFPDMPFRREYQCSDNCGRYRIRQILYHYHSFIFLLAIENGILVCFRYCPQKSDIVR